MSRKKMSTFNSTDYMNRLKKKRHATEESVFAWIAKTTGMKTDTVKAWFRENRIPTCELMWLDVFLCPKPTPCYTIDKVEEELPLLEMCVEADGKRVEMSDELKKSFIEEVLNKDRLIPIESDLPSIPVSESFFPKAQFFVDHAFDRFGDFTNEVRVAYLENLANILMNDQEVMI